jgi:hypothetical protein
MRCPSCGHENRESASFCDGRGAPLTSTCPNRGASLRSAAQFCDKCGASLTERTPGVPTPTLTATPALSTSFAAYNREHTEEPINVRIGLNTAESSEEAGDYFGTAFTLAARIANRARGGETLVSDLRRNLAGSVEGVEFRDAERKQLKGIGRRRVYEVAWE